MISSSDGATNRFCPLAALLANHLSETVAVPVFASVLHRGVRYFSVAVVANRHGTFNEGRYKKNGVKG